jgi:hypothetical protein
MEKEKYNGLEKISFVFYPVNCPLEYVWVIIKLANAGVATAAYPSTYASINVAMI